jgi:phosphotransferase system enzyme I (PtsI)
MNNVKMDYFRVRGTGVSPGIAYGEVLLTEKVIFSSKKEFITKNRSIKEWERLQKASERTKKQLEQIKKEVGNMIGEDHSFIFEAHLMILKDKSLLSALEKIIKHDLRKAEWAISQVHDRYNKIFESITDEYLKQRKSDVADVLSRLYRNLKQQKRKKTDDKKDKIIVAHDLLPSEAAFRLNQGNILAIALDMGGATSHTAILARSMNIPAVVGLSNITQKVKNGDYLIVDGSDGEVIIDPPFAVQREFAGKRDKYNNYLIELSKEVKPAFSLGAKGIGLFRSEFIYFQRTYLPDEEDHFKVYSKLAEDAAPFPVYIRTVDIGGEKSLPQMKIEKEPNPALGLRAIRFSLRDREMFKVQLRAILRASVQRNIRLLIPMITEMEEIEEVKLLLKEVKEELQSKNILFDENIPLGVMIEVPAAAAVSDKMAKEVDYFSIGTNDLIQYYLAVDRTNELVSHLFKPLHPSVLRLLKFIIKSAHKAGIEVSVCGEMSADPLSALVLLGLGIRKFSMNPIFIPRIKRALRSVECQNIEKIVRKAMTFKTAHEIEEYVIEKILFNHPTALLMQEVPLIM